MGRILSGYGVFGGLPLPEDEEIDDLKARLKEFEQLGDIDASRRNIVGFRV